MRFGGRDVLWIGLMVVGWAMVILGVIVPPFLLLVYGWLFNTASPGAPLFSSQDLVFLGVSVLPLFVGIALLVAARKIGTSEDRL
jgi:hypothetical protein